MSVLADWLLLGHEKVGSRALGSTKVDLFTAALETWTKSMASVINAHGIPRLLALNGVSREHAPQLRPSRIQQIDMSDFVDAIARATTAGLVTADEPLENHIRAMGGWPAKQEGEVA